MYTVHKTPDSDTPELKSTTDLPDLSATTTFWKLLQTLPETEPIPPAIVNFGLLTRHLTSFPDDISVNRDEILIEEVLEAVVPPDTLRTVRYILLKESDHLESEEKQRVGELCDSTGLDCPPERGDKEENVAEVARQQNPMSLSCFEELSKSSRSDAQPLSATTSTGSSPDSAQTETDNSSNTGEDTDTHRCEYCGKVCTNKGGLTSHERSCSENPNADKSRPSSGDRSKSDSKHSCPHCSNTYNSQAALEGHKKFSHQNGINISKSDNGSDTKYKCRYCKKKFESKRKRTKHEKNCSGSIGGGSVGKEVKKDNRGERVAGKNPFAEPDRIKDTGLHQGGG